MSSSSGQNPFPGGRGLTCDASLLVRDRAPARPECQGSVGPAPGRRGSSESWDVLIAAAMAGDHTAVERLLAADPGVRQHAIERHSDQLVRAAGQHSYEAVALLIEPGFDVNARARTTPT